MRREGEGDEEIAVRDRRKKSQGGAGVPKIGAGEEERCERNNSRCRSETRGRRESKAAKAAAIPRR